MPRIFLSYLREHRPAVEALARTLHDFGYVTYFDTDLHVGERWWPALLDEIERRDVVVPVIGPGYLGSDACRRELEWAAALRKHILPVSVDPQEMRAHANYPEFLRMAHWVAYDPRTPHNVAPLVKGINAVGHAPALPDPMPARPEAPGTGLEQYSAAIYDPQPIPHLLQPGLVRGLHEQLRTGNADAAAILLSHLKTWPEATHQTVKDVEAALRTYRRPLPPPNRRRKGPSWSMSGATVGLTIIAAVLAFATAGFWAWGSTAGGGAVSGVLAVLVAAWLILGLSWCAGRTRGTTRVKVWGWTSVVLLGGFRAVFLVLLVQATSQT